MIRYTNIINEITAPMLTGFFEGWKEKPDPKSHMEILRRSYSFIAAIDDESGKVIGFICALSDGVITAYISLLEVLPDYRRQGVGTELVRLMLETLAHITNIDLICDKELMAFYNKFDMRQTNGMVIRKYLKSSCC